MIKFEPMLSLALLVVTLFSGSLQGRELSVYEVAALKAWQSAIEQGTSSQIEDLARVYIGDAGLSLPVLGRMAVTAFQQDRLPASILLFRRIREIDPSNDEIPFNLALACLKDGRPEEARKELESLSKPRKTAEVYQLIGQASEALGDTSAALEAYTQALQRDPQSEDLYLKVGFGYLKQNQLPAALDVLERGSRQFPGSEAVLLGLATAQTLSEHYSQARATFLKVLEHHAGSSRAYVLLAQFAISSRDYESPIPELMEKFTSLNPASYLAHYYHARILFESGSREARIVQDLERAVALQPDFPDSYLLLAQWYKSRAQFEKALESYLNVLKLNPEQVEAHYQIADVYRELDRPEEARRHLARFQELKKKSSATTP